MRVWLVQSMLMRAVVFMVVVACAVMLAGCTGSVPTDGACLALRPQFPFKAQPKDTPETKRGAYVLNTAYDAACGGPAP